MHNLRTKRARKVGDLSYEEFQEAEVRLRKIVQSHVFEKSDAQIFKNLQKFQDNRNIWRVKTRLTLSEETFNFKYPVVIPSRHP